MGEHENFQATNHPILYLAISLVAGLAAMFAIRGCVYTIDEMIPKQPVTVSRYDVNKDGLEDLVYSDKTIQVKQADGSYIPLKELESQDYKQIQVGHDSAIAENRKEFNEANKRYNSRVSEIESRKLQEVEETRDKYTLKPEQARNSVDNLDYKVNTGRYIIGK